MGRGGDMQEAGGSAAMEKRGIAESASSIEPRTRMPTYRVPAL